MTSIPLSLVVGFLRPRDALHVLGGAPYTSADVCGIAGLMVDAIDWELEQRPDAVLYLGDGEVCPAAEGWTSRVLAMAAGLPDLRWIPGHHEGRRTHLPMIILNGPAGSLSYAWYPTDTDVTRLTDEDGTVAVYLPGLPPSTPAERLAAVLTYELERVR